MDMLTCIHGYNQLSPGPLRLLSHLRIVRISNNRAESILPNALQTSLQTHWLTLTLTATKPEDMSCSCKHFPVLGTIHVVLHRHEADVTNSRKHYRSGWHAFQGYLSHAP